MSTKGYSKQENLSKQQVIPRIYETGRWKTTVRFKNQRMRKNARIELHFFNYDSVSFTYFNTRLTTETFVSVCWLSFAVLHFENFNWTYVYAFCVASTFVSINGNGVTR